MLAPKTSSGPCFKLGKHQWTNRKWSLHQNLGKINGFIEGKRIQRLRLGEEDEKKKLGRKKRETRGRPWLDLCPTSTAKVPPNTPSGLTHLYSMFEVTGARHHDYCDKLWMRRKPMGRRWISPHALFGSRPEALKHRLDYTRSEYRFNLRWLPVALCDVAANWFVAFVFYAKLWGKQSIWAVSSTVIQ